MRIEMENVVKDFGKVRALNGIDLQIPSGRRIGLIGPNGSGKSTLAKILIGLQLLRVSPTIIKSPTQRPHRRHGS